MERETGVEPATFALARQRSTTELFPQHSYIKWYQNEGYCQHNKGCFWTYIEIDFILTGRKKGSIL